MQQYQQQYIAVPAAIQYNAIPAAVQYSTCFPADEAELLVLESAVERRQLAQLQFLVLVHLLVHWLHSRHSRHSRKPWVH